METQMIFSQIEVTHLIIQRYTTDCTDFKAHDYVATPWNRMTIPRRCALSCTLKSAHSVVFNCGF